MSAPNTGNGELSSSRRRLADCLAVSLRRDKHGPEIKRIAIPLAYRRDFEHELLLKFSHRRGMPDASLDDVSIALTPIYDNQYPGSTCGGLHVEVVNQRGEVFQKDYSACLFADVASRAATELVTKGVLKPGDTYHYDLVVDEQQAAPASPALDGVSFRSSQKQAPQQYLSRELSPLLAQAEAVGEPSNEHFIAFYTAEAYERAERFARRGAGAQPPRETGAALVGTLCACRESGELYAVITDALEATDAGEEKTSLTYTGKTWRRLQAILGSIQLQHATRTYRFLGQAHGHNFIPLDGAPPCDICATVKVCSRTSVFVSSDDRTWTQAVFAGAPYALCHIFGFNARREQVHGLYSLYENCLTQRGFYVIPEFDPTIAE